jgi:hypothetical protein
MAPVVDEGVRAAALRFDREDNADELDPQSDASAFLSETGDEIDRQTFEQILEMDDDEQEREFSRSIVFDFFDQAEGTFKKMDSYV